MKEQVLKIIKKVLTFGFGAVLLLAGAVLLILGNHLGYLWPDYLIAGIVLLVIGAVLYIIDLTFSYLLKKKEVKVNEQK
jgi:uncharacterized membrane protein YdbT with pleckstrin-like domain